MVCFVVYPRKSQFNHAFDWMREVAHKYDIELVLRFDDQIFLENSLPDMVLMRGYNFDLSRWFETRGVRVVNSSDSMALSLNKYLSHLAFIKFGLPVSSTYKVQLGIDYSTAVSMISDGRFIIKGIYGQKGEQVWLVDDENSYAEATNQCDKEFLIQKFIEESYGRDIRVWVVGRKAVGAVLRENKTSFKSNISAGGAARKFDLTPEISSLAVEATNAVGLEIAGVDILIGKNGYLLCEINGNAGFRSAVATAQRDVVQQMFQYLVVAKSAPFP